jgi:N-dimethylarginine dimethylaminohydrolase
VGKNSLQIASIRVKIENTFVPINNKKIIMIVGLTEPETRLLLQAKGYEVISITTIETMKPLKPENLHEIIYK